MEAVQQGIDAVRQRIPRVGAHGNTVKPNVNVEAIDKLIASVHDAQQKDPSSDLHALLEVVSTRLDQAHADVTESNRHYYVALNKLWRAVDKKFPTSLDDMINPSLFGSEKCTQALDTVVLDYLLRAGHTQVAELFSEETGAQLPEPQKAALAELCRLFSALETGQTQPILAWASAHGDALRARHSALEYYLLRNQFLGIVQGDVHYGDDTMHGLATEPTTNVHLAFLYGRKHFAPYLATHLDEIQQLYALLLYLPKFPVFARGVPLDEAPDTGTLLSYVPERYKNTLSALRIDTPELAAQFRADFCALAHLGQLCPLQASVDVGANNALGRINKVRQVMKERGNEWSQADELPVRLSSNPDRDPPPPRTAAAQHFSVPREQRDEQRREPTHDDAVWPCALSRQSDAHRAWEPRQVPLLSRRVESQASAASLSVGASVHYEKLSWMRKKSIFIRTCRLVQTHVGTSSG